MDIIQILSIIEKILEIIKALVSLFINRNYLK